MSDRIAIVCPNCRHELQVRSEYAGRTVVCNYCYKPFPVPSSGLPDPARAAEAAGTAGEEKPRTAATAAAELEWARGKITRLRAQRQALARELLAAKNELGPLQVRALDLESQLEQARSEAL